MKKALFSLFVLVASLSSQAAYLYWQVGQLDGVESDITSGTLKATNGTDEYNLVTYYLYSDPVSGKTEWKPVTDDLNLTVSPDTQFASYISNEYMGSDWSYYVELANGDDAVAQSEKIGYSTDPDSDFASYTSAGTTATDLPDAASVEPWHASESGYSPVPEPTSGLLMLFGAAMLGLKRKNRSRA